MANYLRSSRLPQLACRLYDHQLCRLYYHRLETTGELLPPHHGTVALTSAIYLQVDCANTTGFHTGELFFSIINYLYVWSLGVTAFVHSFCVAGSWECVVQIDPTHHQMSQCLIAHHNAIPGTGRAIAKSVEKRWSD